ncbi:hypothetical protein LT493_04860 [Streptomyces tricolor]|nr:hypothetical protein [Streptomyces tricolor]
MDEAVEVADRAGDEFLDLEVLKGGAVVEAGDAGAVFGDRRGGLVGVS